MKKVLIGLGLLLMGTALVIMQPSCSDKTTCGTNATLNEAVDPAVCVCDAGFKGDGQTCTAITWKFVSSGGMLHDYQLDASAHTCAIDSDDALWCWGSGRWGQLGKGDYSSSMTPVQVGTDTGWTQVSVGGLRTCGIRGGALYCWGANRSYSDNGSGVYGLLGLGVDYDAIDTVAEPTQVGTDTDWVYISNGSVHSCGIRSDGTNKTLWCWGKNDQGAVGDGSTDDRNAPVQEDGEYTDWATVYGGWGYEGNVTCGIRDDGATPTPSRTIWCWGYGNYDYAGNAYPEQMGSDTDWQTADLGPLELCAIKTSGALYCQGYSAHGQQGQGNYTSQNSMAQIGTDTTWTDVNVGRGHVCGINNGKMYCWGRNHIFELGLGADTTGFASCATNHDGGITVDCTSPELVDDTNTWTSVASGRSANCGITDAGLLYCWGDNQFGQTGIADALTVYTPEQVK
jgi:hypothetical protein